MVRCRRLGLLVVVACALALPAIGCGGSSGGGTPPVVPPLTIGSITPTGGPPGTAITITGTGFSAGGVSVVVGGVPCVGTMVTGDTSITCTIGGGVGNVPVTVTTAAGAAPVPGGFTFDGVAGTVAAGSTTRVRIGDEFRATFSASIGGVPASIVLLNRLPGMQFAASPAIDGTQALRWVASRHAGGRHRLNFAVPGFPRAQLQRGSARLRQQRLHGHRHPGR